MLRPRAIPAIVRSLLKNEASSGKLIIIATIIAIALANSPLAQMYNDFWHINFSVGFGDWLLTYDLRHWINEALMAIFFLVVGLEIKRELVQGELRQVRTAMLPIAAAIGGMIIPALLFVALNQSGEGARGWAIPMATDIAFAVGVLALLGKRVPISLKLFLLTLAIVDDVGAILVIALFYGGGLNLLAVGVMLLLVMALLALQKKQWLTMPLFLLFGVFLWLAINAAGIHASITGALLGLLAPIGAVGLRRRSLTEDAERFFIPISTLCVVPLFALANTGVALTFKGFNVETVTVAWGIILGLIFGKVIGVVGMSWLMVKARLARLPRDVTWQMMLGVGWLAGIGFTVSIFVTELAFFSNEQLSSVAKISIFAASVLSGLFGFLVLRLATRSRLAKPNR